MTLIEEEYSIHSVADSLEFIAYCHRFDHIRNLDEAHQREPAGPARSST